MEKPSKDPASVAQVWKVDEPSPSLTDVPQRSFPTKSQGNLIVNFAISKEDLDILLNWNEDEVEKLPRDVQGLRGYTVSDLPKAGKTGKAGRGGNEYHRIRFEKIKVLVGKIELVCEDVYGQQKVFILEPNQAVYLPPFILHTYTVLVEGTVLKVTASTLFDADDLWTHDTYPLESFRELQKQYKSKKGL
ncbi:WxcM-like domain-containing protein [Patescibacteria group bacterium AH-259-L07]|nr:WxcM-like domain-containing protein [Patescibacteria group bacterium AH-259-L07]